MVTEGWPPNRTGLNPNSGEAYDYYGLMLSSLERNDEALEMQRRAHELDPLAHRMDLVTTYLRAGRYEEALRGVTRVLEVEPFLPLVHLTLGWVQLLTGKAGQGVATLEKGLALSPDNSLYLAQVGQAYGMVGRTDEARAVLRRLEDLSTERYVSPYHMAYVHTGLETKSGQWTGWSGPTGSGRAASSVSKDRFSSPHYGGTPGLTCCFKK